MTATHRGSVKETVTTQKRYGTDVADGSILNECKTFQLTKYSVDGGPLVLGDVINQP